VRFARELARKLADIAVQRQSRRGGLLIGLPSNDQPASEHLLAPLLEQADSSAPVGPGSMMRRTFSQKVDGRGRSREVRGPEMPEGDIFRAGARCIGR